MNTIKRTITHEEYETITKRLDEIAAQYNPCDFDKEGSCLASRNGLLFLQGYKSCCKACLQLGEMGCTTRNILCKSFFCHTALQALPATIQAEVNGIEEKIMIALGYGIAKSFYYKHENTLLSGLGLNIK